MSYVSLPETGIANVLDFPGLDISDGSGSVVDFGLFYPNHSISVGDIWVQGWVQRRDATTHYFWTMGSGGAHPMMIGFDSNGLLTGNSNGAAASTFTWGSQTCDPVAVGQWVFVELGVNLAFGRGVLRINGLVVSKMVVTSRFSTTVDDHLWIGGDGHVMGNSRMGWLQIWDGPGKWVGGPADGVSQYCNAEPPRFQMEQFRSDVNSVRLPADFQTDMVSGSSMNLLDTGVGLLAPVPYYKASTAYVIGSEVLDAQIYYFCIQAGTGQTPASSAAFWTPVANPGLLPSNRATVNHAGQLWSSSANKIVPVRMYDAGYPPSKFDYPRAVDAATIKTAYAPPALNAIGGSSFLSWDSFGGRANSLVTIAQPTLGSTEGGTLGARAWQHPPAGASGEFHGASIWNGNVCYSGVDALYIHRTVQFIDVGQSNHGAQIRKPAGSLAGAGTIFGFDSGPGPVVRYVDQDNQFYVQVINNLASLIKLIAGAPTAMIGGYFGGGLSIAGWDELALTVSAANLFTIWKGVSNGAFPGVVTWTSVGTATDAALSTATKAGFNFGYGGSYGRVSEFGAFSV